jgi:hypothetical protein
MKRIEFRCKTTAAAAIATGIAAITTGCVERRVDYVSM